MSDKSKFKEAMFQYSMLENSVSWWERNLNRLLTEMENLPPNHPSLPTKRERVRFILQRLKEKLHGFPFVVDYHLLGTISNVRHSYLITRPYCFKLHLPVQSTDGPGSIGLA